MNRKGDMEVIVALVIVYIIGSMMPKKKHKKLFRAPRKRRSSKKRGKYGSRGSAKRISCGYGDSRLR